MDLETPLSDDLVRFDNALIVDFLCGCASAFQKLGPNGASDANSLRIALHSIQSISTERSRPIFQAITEQQAEFLLVLSSRYGANRLGSNLLRYTLTPALYRLISSLTSWGTQLIPSAKQQFNQRFLVFEQDHCERQTLFSGIILSIAQKVDEACHELWQVSKSINRYFPHAMASSSEKDFELDRLIAESLGFNDLCFDHFPHLSDSTFLSKIATAIDELIRHVEEVDHHLQRNHQVVLDISIKQICSMVSRETRLLKSPRGQEPSMNANDLERLQYIKSIDQLAKLVHHLEKQLFESIKQYKNQSQTRASIPRAPGDVKRRVINSLIDKGHPIKKAQVATQDLVSYLNQNGILAKNLLGSELSKINPSLNQESLNLLSDFCTSNDSYLVAKSEKQSLLKKSELLLTSFAAGKDNLARLGLLSILALSIFCSGGCGLKANPSNTQLDFRPPVPERFPDQDKPMPIKSS